MKNKDVHDYISNLKKLHSIIIGDYDSHDRLFNDILSVGLEIFQCTIGIISRIEGDNYTVWETSNELGIKKGDVFKLENTYCNIVVKEEQTIFFNNGGVLDHIRSHPVYINMKLETYISSPLIVNGKIFGTLNFSSHRIKERPFNEYEKDFIELMAYTIGRYIEVKESEKEKAQLAERNLSLQKAVKNLTKINVLPGVHYISIPEADLYILCGTPEDVVKHLKLKGIIVTVENNGITYETGPNAILLSDMPVQNSLFSNLGEFPIMQMLYKQGRLLPDHPNFSEEKPLLIGDEQQVNAQLSYIYRGNYGLLTKEEMEESGLDQETIETYWQIKQFFAFGKINKSSEFIDTRIIKDKPVEIKNGVKISRKSQNNFEISYNGKNVDVDLNLKKGMVYKSAVYLPYTRFRRDYFSVLHTGDGNGWDPTRTCMSSVVIYAGEIYIIDAGPNILNILNALGINMSEIAGIFQTHSHDDHFAGLPALILSDRKINYYSSKIVRLSVQKKLSALLSTSEQMFYDFFNVHDLEIDKWNTITGMKVMPILSPHPVETNIFKFKAEYQNEEFVYTHLADTTSFRVVDKMVESEEYDKLNKNFKSHVQQIYLERADIKKIDIGGGMIHGEVEDFSPDKSDIIYLSHKDEDLSQLEKEIGSEASFGSLNILVKGEIDYPREKARSYLRKYFPNVTDESIHSLSEHDIEIINPGTILIRKGIKSKYIYLTLTGSIEYIDTQSKTQNILPSGSIIGDKSLIYDSESDGTYRSLNHMLVLTISADYYLQFLSENQLVDYFKDSYSLVSSLTATQLFNENISYLTLKRLSDKVKSVNIKEKSKIVLNSNKNLIVVKKGKLIIDEGVHQGCKMTECTAGDFYLSHVSEKSVLRAETSCEILVINRDDISHIPIISWKLFEDKCFID
jgi:hemerythrin